MRCRIAVVSLLLGGCAAHKPVVDTPPITLDASAAWSLLASELPGTWVATLEGGGSLEVSYRLFSRDSALLETFGAEPGKQTLSVYHPDGRGLLMTHYCAQGNQARLRATGVSRIGVVFSFVDATNVTAEQSVMRELVLFLGPDTLDRNEVYVGSDGTTETSTMHFVRRPAASP